MMEGDSTSVVEIKKFPLNYDCAFELFKHVDLDECMSLAEAYDDLRPIADLMYKRKFNKLSFNFRQPINRILRRAGPTAKSLTLTLDEGEWTSRTMKRIGRQCKQLRCLTIKGFQNKSLNRSNPFVNSVKSQLEVLTLVDCSLNNENYFLDGYTNLKCFNIFACYDMQLIPCFENNPQMISLTCNGMCFQVLPLLSILKNLERLSLRYRSQYMTLLTLSELPLLRHLTLLCSHDNVDYVLADLAKSNLLEELVLVDVNIEEQTFPLIKSLQNLKLLAISTSRGRGCPFPTSKDMPTILTKLKLEGFRISNDDIAPVVQRLRHLEDILLKSCEVLRNELWVSDFDSMADLIVDDLTGKDIYRSLNVAVEVECDESPKRKVKSVGRVRITNYVENKNIFEIQYPGMDSLFPETIEDIRE